MIAKLVELKTFLKLLLVLVRVIIHPLTHGTLEIDKIILRHRLNFDGSLLRQAKKVKIHLEPMEGFEPTTFALQKRCSTPELHRHKMFGLLILRPMRGAIEPAFEAYKDVRRKGGDDRNDAAGQNQEPDGGQGRIRTFEGVSQQIYSLSSLTA